MLKQVDPREVWKRQYENAPDIVRLVQSSQYAEVLRLVAMRKRSVFQSKWPIEYTIAGMVQRGLKGPDFSERMTGSERRKVASSIVAAATNLRENLKPLLVRESFPFEYQATFDRFALDVATDLSEQIGGLDDEAYGQSNNGALHLLMECIPETLDTIIEATEWWAKSERILKKPNDPNAKRLFFIRTVTRGFFYEFKTPMRAATLALTSIFFNCDDIDEAALARLAPPPRPPAISRAGQQKMLEQFEELLASGAYKDEAERKEAEEIIALARERLNETTEKH